MIDREADLLMRGVREGNLEGLRKRISTLFLQYIKTPTFNPEAAKLLKVHKCLVNNRFEKNINFMKFIENTGIEFQIGVNATFINIISVMYKITRHYHCPLD